MLGKFNITLDKLPTRFACFSLYATLQNFNSLYIHLLHRKVDHFTLCCYAKKFHPGVSCIARQKQGFSSCDALLKNEVLQYAMWILGISALAGNLFVFIWRVVKSDRNRVGSFLLTNLAVADLLMGVYMIIIAYKNYAWRGVYFQHDITWRGSKTCVYTG